MLIICIVIEPFLAGLLVRGKCEFPALTWARGYAVILALMAVPGMICCLKQTSLTFFITVFGAVLIIADIAGIILLIYNRTTNKSERSASRGRKTGGTSGNKTSGNSILLAVIAAVLILIQCLAPVFLEHTDTDDATYVALASVSSDTDTTLSFSPRSGSAIVIDKKPAINIRIVSPMHLYYASVSKLSNIKAAVICHTVMPPFLTLTAYIFFYYLAKLIFKGDRKKSLLFLIFLSLAHLFSGFSVYTSGTFMLVRLWQGKAQFAAIIVPALIFTYLYICENGMTVKNWFFVLALLLAAAVMTPTGNFLSVICALILSLASAIVRKAPSMIPLTVLAVLPNLGLLGFYALMLR